MDNYNLGLSILIHLNLPQSLLSKLFFQEEANHQSWAIGNIRILGIGVELAWNGGSCGGISIIRHKCLAYEKTLH